MYWLIAAVILVVAEMFFGTFYLLVVSAALACAGLAQWLFGTSPAVNAGIAAVMSVIGIALVLRWHKKHHRSALQVAHDDLDLGQTVVLEHPTADGLWLVRYRGTQWQAELTGTAAPGATARIVGRHGNVLRLAAPAPAAAQAH